MKAIQRHIEFLYPGYGDFWSMLVDASESSFITPDQKWAVWGRTGLRDLADLTQTARKHFRAALIAYRKQYRHLPAKGREIAKVYYFREAFDYAAISLVSAVYNYTSALWHFHLRINEPESKYPTPHQVARWLKERGIPESQSQSLLSEIALFTNHKGFISIQKYRHTWIHRGYPLIRGEIRRTRRDVYSDTTLIASTFGMFGNGFPFVAAEKPEYSIFALIRMSSQTYSFFLRRVVNFIRSSMQPDRFAKYDIPSALAIA